MAKLKASMNLLTKAGIFDSSRIPVLFANMADINCAHEVFNTVRNEGNQSDLLYENYLGFLARKGDIEGMRRGMKMADLDGIKSSTEWKIVYLQYHAHRKDTKSMDEILSSLSSSKSFPLLNTTAFEYIIPLAQNKEILEKLINGWKEHLQSRKPNFFVARAFVERITTLKAFDTGLHFCAFLADGSEVVRDKVYVPFVVGMLKAGELVKAEHFLGAMNIRPNQLVCNNFIWAYAVKWDLEKVARWMETMNRLQIKKDEFTFNPLIDAAAKRNDVEMAKFFLRGMKEIGVTPTAYTYNSIMTPVIDQPEKLMGYLEEMLKLGIQPTSVTFSTVVGAALRKGKMELANHYRIWFKTMGVEPTQDDYEGMAFVVGKKMRNWEGFTTWINFMKEEGMSPYNVYRSTVEHEMWVPDGAERAFKIVDQMLADGIAPNEELCNLFVYRAAKEGKDNLVVQWVEYIRENGFKLNSRAYNSLIGRASDLGNYEVAESWMGRMKKESMRPSLIIYNTLIKAAILAGDNLKILHWMQQMRMAGIKPDIITYNSIIHNAAKIGEIDRALGYIEIMKQQGCKPTTHTFAPVLMNVAAKGEDAAKWLAELAKEGLPRDEIVYISLIKGATQAKDITKAKQWLNEMQERGVEVGNGTYSVLADCAAENGNLEEAIGFIKQMKTFTPTTKQALFRLLKIVKDAKKEIRAKSFAQIVRDGNVDVACSKLLEAWKK